MDTESQFKQLLAKAKEVLKNAYAPYSKFSVAAAVLDDRGRIFTGVNIENASYSLTICAERSAVFAAITNGAKSITAVAIVSDKQSIVRPCGACRQVIAEFSNDNVPVISESEDGKIISVTVGELLPMQFRYTNN